LSEGGLAVAAAEMAFAGGLGARLEVDEIAASHGATGPIIAHFGESNSVEFERTLADVAVTRIGEVTADDRFVISHDGRPSIDASIAELKEAWQATFRW
jgi:phosphoribosylformylglycinamidine synthase